ncbi:MAG: hypothetical protein DUD27_06015 [Lachnospiraceae bacterium]|uniref:Alcohol acetyltransferase n=1 Tax=Candidatus Weimeria bifida TaxID=2599074 RepID=A0A6N7IXQ0_9FIRM|nr:hypothetical protein [Candidatus Weimeria bifida]RRF96081.1 MAG: hypothetical protein DUD27_06015 [Lachnospiraceae bacterium]
MPHRMTHWEKLDNSALLFPAIATNSMTNTYRLAVILKEKVIGDILQEALEFVLKRFPGFKQRLRKGFFWYYLEENDKPIPKVVEEDTYPCRSTKTNENNSYLFRVTYYDRRINLEVFHVLADGTGGFEFLKELTFAYLRFAHEKLQEKVGDSFSEGTSVNRDDSFVRNYKKPEKLSNVYAVKRAFLIKGEHLPYHGFGVVNAYLSVPEVKKIAHSFGVSINELMVALFMYSTYKAYRPQMTPKRPIRVAVPVNLRPYFDSITTKNFFVMISAEFIPEKDDYTFEEIVDIAKESLRKQITKENLESIFSFNVSGQQMMLARTVPLIFKNIGLRAVYGRSALANTTTVTNMGQVNVPDVYADYIESAQTFLSFSKGQGLKLGIASFRNVMTLSFSTVYSDTTLIMEFLRKLSELGAVSSVETNGVFYE